MKYISKGMVIKDSTEDLLFVTHNGIDFQLTGEQAALWLNGRFGFAKTRDTILEEKALHQLARQSLVEIAEGDGPVFEYRVLTQCILAPAKTQSSCASRIFWNSAKSGRRKPKHPALMSRWPKHWRKSCRRLPAVHRVVKAPARQSLKWVQPASRPVLGNGHRRPLRRKRVSLRNVALLKRQIPRLILNPNDLQPICPRLKIR